MKRDSTNRTPHTRGNGPLRNKFLLSLSDAQHEDLLAYQEFRALTAQGDYGRALREIFDLGIKSWKRKNR